MRRSALADLSYARDVPSNTPKRPGPRSFLVALIAFGILSSLVMTPVGCAYHGHLRARRSCDETAIGSNIDDFRARAHRDMDMVFDVPDETGPSKRVSAMAVGFVFLRYFCDVEYVDGKVTSKRLFSLD